MELQDKISVEVAYALAEQQLIIALQVAPQTTALQAIKASGITVKFPEIDLTKNPIGIFGKRIELSTVLNAQDRVEIYRSLIANPKALRKQRAAEAKSTKEPARYFSKG